MSRTKPWDVGKALIFWRLRFLPAFVGDQVGPAVARFSHLGGSRMRYADRIVRVANHGGMDAFAGRETHPNSPASSA
jgi:hypothetical protein